MLDVIQALPLGVSLVIPGFFLAMSAVAIAAALNARKVAAAVEKTAITKIAHVSPGPAALEGSVAAANGTLESVLTGARCCWFHAKVEKQIARNPDRSGDGGWEAIAEYVSCDPFLIADGTGRVAVYPDGADVTPTERSVWYGATPFPGDRNPKKVGPGDSTEDMFRVDSDPNRLFRYTEEWIYDGDPLYVNGNVERDTIEDDDDDFDPNGAVFAQKGAYGVTDEDRAPYAREMWARHSRFRELRASVKKLTKTKIAGGARRSAFLISTTPPGRLAEVNRGGALAAFVIALFPAAIAAGFLWVRFFRAM